MLTRSRKLDIVVAFIFGLIISIPLSLQFVYSWTGNTNTLSPGFAEINQINATQYFFRSNNRSQVLQGNFTGIGVVTDNFDSSGYINGSEFYLNSVNVTEHLEGNYSDSGLITPWLDLGGVNRTTWPAGGGAVFDQSLNTTDDVSFNSVNATSDFYLNSVNVTDDIIDDLVNVSRNGGPLIGPRSTINFIEGANVTLAVADDPANDRINVTVSATGGGVGPAGPPGTLQGLPFSYLVFINSTATYMVNGTTGATDWFSTNSSAIINACIGNCTANGGLIHVRRGTYTLSAPITFTGRLRAGKNYQDFNIIFEGEGMYNTLFQPAANTHGILLRNQTSIFLRDIGIEVPTNNAVDAIFGTENAIQQRCVQYALFENIHIRGGESTAGWYAINLRNPWKFNFRGTNHLIAQGAGGVLINNTMVTQYGDSKWEGYTYIYINRDNSAGISLLGFNSHTTLMTSTMHTYIFAPNAAHNGITGVRLNNARNIMMASIQMEYMDTCFYFNNSQRIQIKNCPFLNTQGDGIIFDVQSNCQYIRLYDMNHIIVGGGKKVTVLNDNVNALSTRTICRSWTVINSGTMFFNRTTYTGMYEIFTNNGGYSEMGGDATVLNGWDNVTVTHNLLATPGHVTYMGTNAELSQIWAVATATQITFYLPNPVTGNRLISWEATINTR